MKAIILSLTILMSTALCHAEIFENRGPGVYNCQAGSDTVSYEIALTHQRFSPYRVSQLIINGKTAPAHCAEYIHGGIKLVCGANMIIYNTNCAKALDSLTNRRNGNAR